jgi:hypothetical protein
MMNPRSFWRYVAWTLLACNVLFALWHQEALRVFGWGPQVVREPQRVQDQLQPERLTLRAKPDAAAANTEAASQAKP